MRPITKILLGSAALLALAACDRGVGSSWTQEAGAFIDEGGFGNPTMNNILVQNGDRDFTIALQQRFANEVPDTINFEFNSAVLDASAQAVLRQQADWIRQFPEVRFRVYGHTDLVGSNAYNQGLGLRRAQAAVAYLSSQGISRSRLEAVASFGETRPVVPTEEPERRNRRTVTEVTGFVARHPTVLDGKYAQIIRREYVNSASAPSGLGGGGLAAIESGGG
jgi:outer membrane protein OmpA-like peptidoglycan-associated protein